MAAEGSRSTWRASEGPARRTGGRRGKPLGLWDEPRFSVWTTVNRLIESDKPGSTPLRQLSSKAMTGPLGGLGTQGQRAKGSGLPGSTNPLECPVKLWPSHSPHLPHWQGLQPAQNDSTVDSAQLRKRPGYLLPGETEDTRLKFSTSPASLQPHTPTGLLKGTYRSGLIPTDGSLSL